MKNIFYKSIISIEDIIFILILTSMYFPYNKSIGNVCKVLTYIVIIATYFFKKRGKLKVKLLNKMLIIISIVTLCVLLSDNYFKQINYILQLICFILLMDEFRMKPSIYKRGIIFISTISIVMLFIYNITYDGRHFLSDTLDANYSGYYIFLLFVISDKFGYKIMSKIIAFIGFFTLSRNYILAIIMYIILDFNVLKRSCQYILKKKYINFITLSLICIIGVIFITYWYTGNFDYSMINKYSSSYRNFNLWDGSNNTRFNGNIIFFNEILENRKIYLWGINEIQYMENVRTIFPHNAYFLGIIRFGVLFIPYLILFSTAIKKENIIKNYKVILTVLIFMSILGLGINGIDILLLSLCLKNNNHNLNIKCCNKIKDASI